MKRQYNSTTIDIYWDDYWRRCGKDTNFITNNTIYPLYPIDKYIKRDHKILECGCGLGRVLKHYYYQGYNIEGIELNSNAVKMLLNEDPMIPVKMGNVLSIPYADGEFDVVMAFGVVSCLEQIQDRDRALNELRRVTKKGGLLCCSVNCDNVARSIFRMLKTYESFVKKSEKFFYSWCYKKNEFAKILSELGFEIVEVQPSITRAPLYMYFPFMRESRQFDLSKARNGDQGYRLNYIGESLFKIIRKMIPSHYAEGLVYIGEKT